MARLLEEAEEDLLAYMRFPRDHWSKIRSTNPLERVNREIARRSDVVGIYPDDAALLRLAAGVLVEINDEWLVLHRYISQASMALLVAEDGGPCGPVGADQPGFGGSAGRRREVHHVTGLDWSSIGKHLRCGRPDSCAFTGISLNNPAARPADLARFTRNPRSPCVFRDHSWGRDAPIRHGRRASRDTTPTAPACRPGSSRERGDATEDLSVSTYVVDAR